MTRPTKRQRQAKQQRASRAKAFDSGFIEGLLEITLDQDYQPESEPDIDSESESHCSDANFDLSFNLMDTSEIEEDMGDSDDEESDVDSEVACTGPGLDVSKWQWIGDDLTNAIAQYQAADNSETDDYVAICACEAATTAHQFWSKTMVKFPVSVVNAKRSD